MVAAVEANMQVSIIVLLISRRTPQAMTSMLRIVCWRHLCTVPISRTCLRAGLSLQEPAWQTVLWPLKAAQEIQKQDMTDFYSSIATL
jgi:hypothetical protein